MQQETYEKIICFLAHHKEATQYEIAKDKEVGLTYAPIHQGIEELLFTNLVEEVRNEKGQGPLPKRYFRLTFLGFITALALLAPPRITEDKSGEVKMENDLRKAILTQRESHPDIKIFSEWEFLEKTFCDDEKPLGGIYKHLIDASVYCFDKFDPLVAVNWRAEQLKELRKRGKHLLPDPTVREQEARVKETVSLMDRTQRAFLKVFFASLMWDISRGFLDTKGDAQNKVLFDFISSFFEKEKQKRTISIKKMEKTKDLLLKQFGTVSAT